MIKLFPNRFQFEEVVVGIIELVHPKIFHLNSPFMDLNKREWWFSLSLEGG